MPTTPLELLTRGRDKASSPLAVSRASSLPGGASDYNNLATKIPKSAQPIKDTLAAQSSGNASIQGVKGRSVMEGPCPWSTEDVSFRPTR
jgi:hypothetical protein